MENLRLSSEMLENIVQRTLNELENGRTQIFQFAEAAREECTRVERVLEAVQFELQLTVENVEDLTTRFTTIRERLYEVNKEFHEYSEEKKRKHLRRSE